MIHDPLCIGGDKGPCNCQWIRIEKLEKALSEEMAKTREMDGILAGVVKRVGYEGEATKNPDPGVAHVAGEGQFRTVPYDIAIDPKASPSGIPFSVALEYLKAGRKLTHPSFEEGNSIEVLLPNLILMRWPEEGRWTNFVMDSALALSDAWTVLPETQNP